MRKTIAFSLFVVLTSHVYGQLHKLQFGRISTSQGLSSNWVTAIHQDRQGFLWLATLGGLNRYDGNHFTVFKANPVDSTALRKDAVTCLEEDQSGNLWVGTWAGLHRYDPRRMQFRYFPRPAANGQPEETKVMALSLDSAGILWMATETDGISSFDPKTGWFNSYRHRAGDENTLSHDSVRTLTVTNDGNIWIATAKSVDRLLPATGQFRHFRPDERRTETKLFEKVYAITEGRDGSLWFGTWEYGLVSFDRHTGAHKRYSTAGFTPERESPIWISCIWEDHEGCLWIGTLVEGLLIFDPKAETFRQYRYDHKDPKSLSSRSVTAIMRDRSDIVWIGTVDGGMSKHDLKKKKFQIFTFDFDGHLYQNHNDISSMYEDGEGILWLGTIGKKTDPGLIRFDRRNGKYRRVMGSDSPIPNVYSIREDWERHLLLATYGDGIFRLDPRTLHFQRFLQTGTNILHEEFIRTLHFDDSGPLWIGTRTQGVYRFDRSRDVLSRILPDHSHLNQIVTIEQRGSDQCYIGTAQNGLFVLGPGKGFTQYKNIIGDTTSISSNTVIVIHRTQSGLYWIGTTEGLNRYDPRTGKFTQYTEHDGFPAASICGILEDNRGNLWVSTERGIVRFNDTLPPDKRYRLYHPVDGVQPGEFNRGSYFKSRQGEFFFGGKEGLNSFFPEEVTDNVKVPATALLSVRRGDITLPIEKATEDDGRLLLDYQDNVITFEFTALEFTDPSLNEYACKMEGFDRNWRPLGTQSRTTYTNLDPGDYVFRVKASNIDGIWNETGASLPITVLPPYWLTWWFRGLLIAVFFGVLSLIAWQRERTLAFRRQTQERFSKQLIESQESERKRIASELHDSLGQNILIMKNNALLALQKSGDAQRVEKHLNDISAIASQTLDETRRIAYHLRPFQLDRFGLTEAIKVMIHDAEQVSNVKFLSTIESVDDCFSKESEISLFRIIQEAVNNVLKHSSATQAGISIARAKSVVSIRIADNGKGYSSAAEESETDPSHNHRGGFGIHSIRERVQIVGGTFSISTGDQGGTNLDIAIPELNSK